MRPVRFRQILLTVAAISLGVWQADAHDIPNAQVDRSIQVTVHRDRLDVDYEVSLAELTLVQDLRTLIGTVPRGDREALFELYAKETGPLNAKGVLVTFDGRPVDLHVQSHDLVVEDHPRYVFHLAAPLGPRGRLSIRDTNYVASEGTSRLALNAAAGVTVRGYDGPPRVADVPVKPVWQLSDAEERRTKQVDVDIAPAAIAQRSTPSSPTAVRSSAFRVAQAGRTERGAQAGLAGLLSRASRRSLVALWIIALGLGAAHALQPGHGKMIVAAGTTTDGHRWGQGTLLAMTLTLTHTGSVLAVAGVVWLTRSTRYSAINESLAHAAGFAIAAVGLWRLGRYLGRFEANEEFVATRVSAQTGIIALGVSGGLVPCWDAILLVLEAEFLGQFKLGLFLLSAFSLGMALVLVLVAFGSARLRRFAEANGRFAAWSKRITLLSALVLTGIGLYLLFS